MGMVEGRFSKEAAASRCGCASADLCPGPLAGIDKGDKIRTIYDGSVGGANDTIRNQTVERTTPTVLDGVQALHCSRGGTPLSGCLWPRGGDRQTSTWWGWLWPEPGTRWVLLKANVTKAHRRVKVLRKDWRFQVASLGEEWWVNKVGTYGMASAQSYYWGRLAALLLRVLYALFPQVDWNFVFVDDFLWLLRSEGAVNVAVALLATLLALGTPLSWKKTHLAEVNTWLGFVVHPNIVQVLMAANKHILVVEVLQIMVEGALEGHREGPGPHPMGNGRMSAGKIDAPATLGMEDGHHHGGETPEGGQDAGVHAEVPLQHAFRPVLPLLAEVLMVGLQRR